MTDVGVSGPKRWIVKALVFLCSLAAGQEAWSQDSVARATTPELYFNTIPSKQLFSLGENVEIGLELYSRLEQPLLVSRLLGNEFVSFKMIGPDGKEVPWQGEVRADAKEYAPSDFAVLEQYNLVRANRTISLKDGAGFVFDKPGQYMLEAEFSMGPAEKFVSFAGQAKPPTGIFHSAKLALCIEACILEPLAVRNDAPPSALEAVRKFYGYITRYRQLGIPYGPEKKAIWPLLSGRLARQIADLEACEKEYYRRYGKMLRANRDKPLTPWLEAGLFTGPNEAATPSTFQILSSRVVGENRVDVLVSFKVDWGEAEGDVTVILENNRWVIDDYVAMYENDELERLSAGYSECRGRVWVGETP